ncbi:MAG: O-antigen ligase family protein [Gammaproteobacteria bacterium]|nr:O-antigen ligase family protein [Gammaproteobacteria bacterium]
MAALHAPLGTRASAFCVAAAFALAVFFNGPQLPLLAGAQALLVAWLGLSLARRYDSGVVFLLTPLSVSLTLFWMWLGLSLLWTPVPGTSDLNFWWVGSVALVFWAYTLSPERERIWFYASRLIALGALALSIHGLVQLFVLQQRPHGPFINLHSYAALLMLILLPLCAHLLTALHARKKPLVVHGLGIGIFIIAFAIAATQGRGTSISLLVSTVILLSLAVRTVGRRPVVVLIGVLVAAYVVANLVQSGDVVSKLSTLGDPEAAGSTRFLIWRGSWNLLKDSPWWGVGLGLYYLVWPPYRHPDDSTLGFFAHNDYLQIWIETGLPGLLLWLAVLVSVLLMCVWALRQRRLSPKRLLELLGLFAGLLAVALHSGLDFDFYILPISIVAGLMLARFQDCATAGTVVRTWTLQPAKVLKGPFYRLVVLLLMLFPISYLVAFATADVLYKKGFNEALLGNLREADHLFAWAEQMTAADDRIWTIHADLYRHVLRKLPPTALAERRALYEEALMMLARAESLNRYRALVPTVRARVVEENSDLAGTNWLNDAEADFRRALTLDPLYLSARVQYARLLVRTERPREAYKLLEAGSDYWYFPTQTVLTYLDFTIQLARQLNEGQRVAELEARVAELRTVIARRHVARLPVAEMALPSTVSAASQ